MTSKTTKITAAAVAAELAQYPAYVAGIGLGIDVETEHNKDQDEQRWLGTDIRRAEFADRGVGAHVPRVLRTAAEQLRHGNRVRVYVISEVSYPTTISSAHLVLDPKDFA